MSIQKMALLSLVVAAVLGVVLWSPWETRGVQRGDHEGGSDLIFYCAAGLKHPVQEIIDEYEKAFGIRVQLEPGGSGKLLSSIRVAQDRGDVYLAADRSYIDMAQQEGLVAEDIPVASMRPVICVAKGNPLGIATIDDLLKEDVKVVLANPELASIGRVTRQLLEPSGFWKKLMDQRTQFKAKVSTVGTVNEVAQAVKLGAADAGIIWNPLAAQFELDLVDAPVLAARTEHITVGVLARTKQPTVALQFVRYLTARDKGMVHFTKHGFEPVADADEWAEHPELLLFSGAMLKPGISETLKEFEAREGCTIKPVYNGCGVLVSQMKGMRGGETPGTFPDGYFSCDISFLHQVKDWFEAETMVSNNDMVMAVKKGNPLGIHKLEDLARAEVKVGLAKPAMRLGLAHPKNSALGKLTDDLLLKVKLHDKVYADGREIIHTDAGHMLVNQLATGSLDAIVVYRSNVLSTPADLLPRMDIVEIDIPEAMAEQPFAVSKDSKHKYLTRRLLTAILQPKTRERFEKVGMKWAYRGDSKGGAAPAKDAGE